MTRILTGLGVLPVLLIVLHPAQVRGVDPQRTRTGTTLPTLSVSPTASTTTTLPLGVRDRNADPFAPTLAQPLSSSPLSPGFGTTLPGTYTVPTGYETQLINPQPRPPRWRLGVFSQDTETGVKIIRVVASSAAERAGLEANDMIVSVGGYQVGLVNGQTFDCSDEFERRADTSGRVMLLVQNSRDRTLVNLPVVLESRLSKISGSLALRNRVTLPQDATAIVELREVLRGDTPAVTIGQQRIDDLGPASTPFEIDYDPAEIDPRRSYFVSATVYSGGRAIYATRDQYGVITGGYPKTVALAVDRVSDTGPLQTADARRAEIQQQIVQWFRDYYGRDPYPSEIPVFLTQVTERGRTMADVQADMLATDQVWTLCDRDKRQYIEMLHQKLLGRAPTQDELDYWTYRFDQTGLRRDISSEFLTQVQSR